jgi:hypothetical protein
MHSAAPGLVIEPLLAVIRVTAVMLDDQDSEFVALNSIVDPVRKLAHYVTPNILNGLDRCIKFMEKAITKSLSPPLIESCSLKELSLGLGVIGKSHLIARRTASMTCSWVRPDTWPEAKSASRLSAEVIASCSSEVKESSAKRSSMLCQRAWANSTRSKSGRVRSWRVRSSDMIKILDSSPRI